MRSFLAGFGVIPVAKTTTLVMIEPPQDDSSTFDHLLLALRRIAQAADSHSRELLSTCGLTGPQLMALKAIAQYQPVKASALARAIHLGHSTVTGILNRLERQGLVLRERGARDRRNVEVRLSEAGERVLGDAPAVLPANFLRRIAKLQSWEKMQLLSSLQRVAEMMGEEEVMENFESAGSTEQATAPTPNVASKSPAMERDFKQPTYLP